MPATSHKSTLQTTTVRLPRRLYEEARRALEKGDTEASSLNDLLVQSLEERLKRLQRELIDREFEQMKYDRHYQRESKVIAKQFAASDRETLRVADEGKSS
jgi:hypothetical protein